LVLGQSAEVVLHQSPDCGLDGFIPEPIALGDLDSFNCRLNISHC
jgi:hypothetical protein